MKNKSNLIYLYLGNEGYRERNESIPIQSIGIQHRFLLLW